MKEESKVGNSVKQFKRLLGAVLFVLAAGGLWKLYHQPALYSDPNEVRDSRDVTAYWNETFHPELLVQPVTSWRPKAVMEESDLYIKRTQSKVSVQVDESENQDIEWRPIPPTLIKVPQESQSVTLPTGEHLSLDRIAIGFRRGQGKDPFYQSFDARNVERVRDDSPWKTYKDYPILKTQFTFSNGKLTIRRLNIFNSATHFKLTNGTTSSSNFNDGSSQVSIIKQWHSSPLAIVADVQGGLEEASIPFRKGQTLETSAVTAKLTWIEPVAGSYTGGSSGGGEFSFSFSTNQEHAVNSTIVGLSILKKNWVPSDLKLIAKIKSPRLLDPFASPVNTQEKPATTFEISARLKMDGSFAVSHFECKANEIEELQLVHAEKEYRLVFTLDSIPGLPNENYDVENLFDLKIPYAEPDFIGRFLADTTQLDFGHLYPRKIEINDMPLHEVVEQVRDNQRNFKITIKNGRISAVPSPKERLRDLWKKIKKTP